MTCCFDQGRSQSPDSVKLRFRVLHFVGYTDRGGGAPASDRATSGRGQRLTRFVLASLLPTLPKCSFACHCFGALHTDPSGSTQVIYVLRSTEKLVVLTSRPPTMIDAAT
jgi:hypothetical protein